MFSCCYVASLLLGAFLLYCRRKIYDEYNDEVVELKKKETKLISRLLEGKAPDADFDPYAPYVDWFKWDGSKHPLSNAPEPKRRFTRSQSEDKMVVRYCRAIRKGLIKFDEPKEEPSVYLLWGDESNSNEKSGHLAYIPAPKPKLPGHEESYNPSKEYIPTQEEINAYQLMFEEDRPKFIPKRVEFEAGTLKLGQGNLRRGGTEAKPSKVAFNRSNQTLGACCNS
ncbi:ribosome biogenesis protein BOP1 homolog [Humulus lupulus]|uniref:ribosome biogenesis protein BOP1 homolog n=1 Tax=Humulus lupulus TaxID=3486 RepID=UPI002B406749|nr:ribosome biogenesis protein BOP1 homolog [Humulus lupulus]